MVQRQSLRGIAMNRFNGSAIILILVGGGPRRLVVRGPIMSSYRPFGGGYDHWV